MRVCLEIKDLKDSHPIAFYNFTGITAACGIIAVGFFLLCGNYLDTPITQRGRFVFVMIPLYIVLAILLGTFLYLLPGICDPENGTDKRLPFLVLLHFIAIFGFLILCNINENIMGSLNAWIVVFPLIFAIVFHFITIFPKFYERSHEGVVLVFLLALIVVLAMMHNSEN